MNILPKKRWHVRTKDNVARVRRDEAQAAAEEKARLERAALAEQEARTRFLREKAGLKRAEDDGVIVDDKETSKNIEVTFDTDGSINAIDTTKLGHVNFFADLEEQERTFGSSKEYEKEKRLEKETEEKKIGLLKYLGEGSSEYMKETPWYGSKKPADKVDDSSIVKPKSTTKIEKPNFDRKEIVFPSDIGLLPKKRKKSKKHKKGRKKSKRRNSSESSSTDNESSPVEDPAVKLDNLHKLRAERLRRENEERLKSQQLLKQLKNGGNETVEVTSVKKDVPAEFQQKYSSQFNPQFARQNR